VQAVNTIEELLEILPQCSGTDFVKLADQLELDPEDFEPYAYWSDESYTRNCVSRNDEYELILLCWEPGQETPVHCHNGEECWVYGLKGEMDEIRFQNKPGSEHDIYETDRGTMKEGTVAYMHDNMGFHSLHNNSGERAMTLHLYMRPIDSCRIYDEEQDRFIRKDMKYTTKDGELL